MALTCKSIVWRSEYGYLGLGFTGDGGGPPFPSFTSSLCASSLGHSRVLIHDNTHATTLTSGWHFVTLASTPYSSTNTHTSAHTHTVAALEAQPPTTRSPHPSLIWVLIHTGSTFIFMHGPFLISAPACITYCILATDTLGPTHPPPGLLISRCHQHSVQGRRSVGVWRTR